MKCSHAYRSVRPSRSGFLYIALSFLVLVSLACAPRSFAQQLTGTLTGTVLDQTGAVIPNANVVLKNEASGDTRPTVTDASGHFTITAVPPGSYSILVSATGFNSWQENGITMNQGDNRAVPNIQLAIGGATQQVEVVGGEAMVPTDTPEISTSLNEQMINDFPLQGRDAGELLKIMPGMALNNGNNQGSGFNAKIVGSNNGPVGDFSANGTQPNGTVAYMLDGANLVDPGNFGTQIANINQDMVSNIKVLTSDFTAEYAKGPVIFQAYSRSGGNKFHGEAYLYTHNSVLNSVDAYTKSQGGTNKNESYYYMGGNVGGPVLLPFLHSFNRDRNKLFFWGGYEYMKQTPAGSINNYNVPNAAQLSGDFSNTGVDPKAVSTWPAFYNPLTKNLPAGATATTLPTTAFDPNILGILNLYPKTNQTPSAANGYTNYSYVNQEPQNRWEATGKVDYAITDNTKLTGSYSFQKESDIAPISIWWSPGWTLPYPSPAASNTKTYLILTNFTHTFNATTTNEAVFTMSHFTNPYALQNPARASRKANNFNVPGLYGHTTQQIPNFEGPWGGALANISNYPFTPGTFGGIKEVPAFYDNFTKLIGAHTLKVGFYWDNSKNYQNSNTPDNGTYNFDTGSTYSTGNLVADVELGRVANYQQQNYSPAESLHFHQVSFYGQDQFKASKQLTINLGLRFDHLGQWSGIPQGFQVWDPASYVNGGKNAPNNTGLLWHATNASVPLSGFKTPLFYYAPRVGFAFDVFGNGRTVFRGGYGVYRYQATTEVGNAGSGPLGSFQYQTPTAFEGYANVATFTPYSSVAQNGSSVYAMQRGDARSPFTNDWNATISQALPWRSVLEVSYIGNRSGNEYMDGTNSNLYNLNNVPPGGFFRPDPVSGQLVSPAAPGCESGTPDGNEPLYCVGTTYPTFTANDFRPLNVYQNVFLLTHAPYSKYNGLQVSFQKQSGPVTFQTNYTFSKVLGIRDGGSNNGNGNGTAVDPFVLQNNYGPLAYDHTHIINLTYNWRLPSLVHGDSLGSHLLGGATNGWELSGYTAFQSGSPIQPQFGGGMNAQFPSNLTVPTVAHPNLPDESIALPNGLRAVGVSPSVWFGSNAYNVLVPALTCNPTKGLKSGQRFNPACFTVPAYGQQGQDILPYMREPNYFDSDLGIYKSFQIREAQRFELRISATNFLNHPLAQFGLAGQSDEQLSFIQTSNATCTGCVDAKGNPLSVQSLSPVNTNTTTTGKPAFKTGSRFVQLAAKYYF